MKHDVDPWRVLRLAPAAALDEVRARYVELVKQHPPDRDPEVFERIRDAYRAASDPRWRARQRLFGPEPLGDLDELETLLRAEARQPAGPAAWLKAAKGAGRR